MTEPFTFAACVLFDKINKQREMRREELRTFFNNKDIQNISASLRALEDRQNRVNAFDFAHKNEAFHSNVIAHILNPQENHALGNAPMRFFIELLNKVSGKLHIAPKSFDGATVTRETENIDILIRSNKDECKDECIIIENKIRWAQDQPSQLRRYYDTQKRDGFTVKAVVYITPHNNKQPEEQAFGKKDSTAKEIRERLVVLPAYPQATGKELNLSHGWVRRLSAEATNTHNDIDTISFLRQYFLCLEKDGQDSMSEQAEQDFIALLKTEENKVNPSYFEIARSFTNGTIDICRCVRSILKENLTECIKKDMALHKCFGGPCDDIDYYESEILLYFTFSANEKDSYGIDLIGEDWGERWTIEIYNNNSNKIDTINDIVKIVPHPKIKIDRWKRQQKRICIGAQEGLQYIGAEDAYHDTVIQVLRAFHTHYNGDIETEKK